MDDGQRTGDQAVDAALDRLAGVEDAPLSEQAGVFDAVHAALADRLAES